MNLRKTERVFALMKSYGVSHFKDHEMEVRMDGPSSAPSVQAVPIQMQAYEGKAPSPQAAPAVQNEIPHHENEVTSLLRLTPEELVDRMFPEAPISQAGE